MNVIFLGAPGAGKGTQAVSISHKLGLAHIASGDLFREATSKGNEIGLLVKSYMEKGMLVPDKITIQMILEHIGHLPSNQGFILDGFPRTLEQAEALSKVLAEEGKEIDKVVYIKVSSEELLRRLSGRWICRNCQAPYSATGWPPKVPDRCDRCGGELYQRSDDTVETARKRLEVYFDQTAPLIDYYRRVGKLMEANGKQDIEKVTEEIVTSLRKANETRECARRES